MSPFSNFMVFVIIGWVVLLCVLPFGVRTADEAGEPSGPGGATSAPVRPQILMKFLVTTLISGLLFGLYYFVAINDLLGFRAFTQQ